MVENPGKICSVSTGAAGASHRQGPSRASAQGRPVHPASALPPARALGQTGDADAQPSARGWYRALDSWAGGERHTHRFSAFSTRSTKRRPPKLGSPGTVGGLKGGATSEMSHLRTTNGSIAVGAAGCGAGQGNSGQKHRHAEAMPCMGTQIRPGTVCALACGADAGTGGRGRGAQEGHSTQRQGWPTRRLGARPGPLA